MKNNFVAKGFPFEMQMSRACDGFYTAVVMTVYKLVIFFLPVISEDAVRGLKIART